MFCFYYRQPTECFTLLTRLWREWSGHPCYRWGHRTETSRIVPKDPVQLKCKHQSELLVFALHPFYLNSVSLRDGEFCCYLVIDKNLYYVYHVRQGARVWIITLSIFVVLFLLVTCTCLFFWWFKTTSNLRESNKIKNSSGHIMYLLPKFTP